MNRITPGEYRWVFLKSLLLVCLGALVVTFAYEIANTDKIAWLRPFTAACILSVIIICYAIKIRFNSDVKRLNDFSLDGEECASFIWSINILLGILLTLLSFFFSARGLHYVSSAMWFVYGLLNLILLSVLMFIKGDSKDKDYEALPYTLEINEATYKNYPNTRGILSRYIPYFSGECNQENFRRAFWTFLLRSILFLIGFTPIYWILIWITGLLPAPWSFVVLLFTIISIIVYFVKCVIPYVKAKAQRLHAFGLSYTMWAILLPNMIFGGIEVMCELDYLEIIEFCYLLFLWGLCFFGSSKTEDTKNYTIDTTADSGKKNEI